MFPGITMHDIIKNRTPSYGKDPRAFLTAAAAEPRLSPLGLGCARVGSFNNPQSLAECRDLIARAIALGVTSIDTANIYGQGDSETQIGLALKGRRDAAFVITKTGKAFSAKMKLLRPFKPLLRQLLAARGQREAAQDSAVTARRATEMREDWAPASFRKSLEESLRRLQMSYVDALLLHSPPPSVAGDPAIGDALVALRVAGKLRHFGVSCDNAETMVAALTMKGLTMLQLPWDVIAGIDTASANAIREQGIMVLAREVIRLQPTLGPEEAVRDAMDHPLVSCALVGTTSRAHLQALAAV